MSPTIVFAFFRCVDFSPWLLDQSRILEIFLQSAVICVQQSSTRDLRERENVLIIRFERIFALEFRLFFFDCRIRNNLHRLTANALSLRKPLFEAI